MVVEYSNMDGASMVILSGVLVGVSLSYILIRWFTARYLTSDEDYLREYFRELDLTKES